MKHFLIVLVFVVGNLRGAVSVYSGSDAFAASYISGAAQTTAAGSIVFGGLGAAGDPAWAGKVVILDRGTIDYLTKLNNAKDAGALAVIIANNTGSGIFNGTLGTGNASTLPAVNISRTDGDKLKQRIGSKVHIGTTPPPAGPPLPPAEGHAGEIIGSDGTNFVWVKLAPTVVALEMGSVASVGQKVTFGVTADGNPAPTFQWHKGGTPIAGATNAALVFDAVAETDAGKYTCVASNSAGNASSQPYTLTVE
jgi:hypothetical protein